MNISPWRVFTKTNFKTVFFYFTKTHNIIYSLLLNNLQLHVILDEEKNGYVVRDQFQYAL